MGVIDRRWEVLLDATKRATAAEIDRFGILESL